MANYTRNSEGRKARTNKILNDFGYSANTATKEQREKAEHIAEKTNEMQRKWRG